jgi:hypothetical protein
MSTEALGEVLAIAGLFNMTNSLADGYQVEPDVLPKVDAERLARRGDALYPDDDEQSLVRDVYPFPGGATGGLPPF